MKVAIVASMSLWWVGRLIPETQKYLGGVLEKMSETPIYLVPCVLAGVQVFGRFHSFLLQPQPPQPPVIGKYLDQNGGGVRKILGT